jgi:hypothetical protein
MKRIFVTGFPHSGTSILRTKLGDGNNVFEQKRESTYPLNIEEYQTSGKEFYLWKNPIIMFFKDNPFDFILENGFQSKPESYYKDDDVVFIMRNPYYSYSSIYKIFKKKFGELESTQHLLNNFEQDFIPTAKLFLDTHLNPYPNVYTLYYEELFENDFQVLQNVMDKIGIKYNVLSSNTKEHFVNDITSVPKTKPEHYVGDIGYYRTWQVNQPFTNFNDPSKLYLPQRFITHLDSSEIVSKLGYTNPYNL